MEGSNNSRLQKQWQFKDMLESCTLVSEGMHEAFDRKHVPVRGDKRKTATLSTSSFLIKL
jgi:hypothetical protein